MFKFARKSADRLGEGGKSPEGERRMTVAVFRIQNILRACHKSIRWYGKKTEIDEESAHGPDPSRLSFNGRRERIRQKAAIELIERLTKAADISTSSSGES